ERIVFCFVLIGIAVLAAVGFSVVVAQKGIAGPYLSEHFLGEGMTIMLRKKDSVLKSAIDHALATLSRKGRLQEIYLR
ncbi:hypothetical protein ACC675_38160, partial [Rhizobium ruizarguesonis]